MDPDEINIADMPLLERLEFYAVVTLCAIGMAWEIYKQYRWEQKVNSIVIPPKVKPEDRVYKYN
jgi:hypothetical protein